MADECDGFAELGGVGAVRSEGVFRHEHRNFSTSGIDEGLEERAMFSVGRDIVAAAVEP